MPPDHRKIFPPAIVEYSVEKHFNRYNPRSKAVYTGVLAVLFVGILLLFIVKVDVSVKSTGVIRSVQEKTEIRTAVEGIVDSLYISENRHVVAGQPLMKIRSKAVDEKGLALTTEREELAAQVADLRALVAGKYNGLQSSLYAQQYNLYRQKVNDVQVRYDLVRKNYNRYAALYRDKVVSAAEFDNYTYQKKAIESEMTLAREGQLNQWQADLSRLERQLNESGASMNIFREEKDQHTIRAQVSGTVQELKGIQAGSFVNPNEVLGEISPDSGLVAEAYVPSKDIGLIQTGLPVRIQVDAFNYNSWGMLTGIVQSISGDIYTDSDQPYFKVRCRLNKNALVLRNGYKGFVKKGMTVQTRFLITRRTLFQLLYDRTDDWLNPNLVKHAKRD